MSYVSISRRISSSRFHSDPSRVRWAWLLAQIGRSTFAVLAIHGAAQSLGPDFIGKYILTDRGPVPQASSFVFKDGNPDRVLMAPGQTTEEEIREYQVLRNPSGKITGLADNPTIFATARPLSPDDRVYWLNYGPSGLLFFRGGFDIPTLGQIKPGNQSPDLRTKLDDLGIHQCCYGAYGQVAMVPTGFPGVGRIKMTAGASWYDTTATPNPDGTLNIAPIQRSIDLFEAVNGQNFVFLNSGLPGIKKPSVVISHSDNSLYVFELDDNGDPVSETRRLFMKEVNELGAIDPSTGDLLVFSGDPNKLIAISPGIGNPPLIIHQEPADNSSINLGNGAIFRGNAVQENGSMARVSLLQNGIEVDENNGPFATVNNQASYFLKSKILNTLGLCTFQVVATAGDGLSTTSAPIRISVVVVPNQSPIANLSLAFGSSNRFLCQSITLVANGSDPDGEVRNMYLLDGNRLVKNIPPPGGQIVVRDLELGNHSLTLQVQDNQGATAVSTVSVSVLPPPANTLVGDFQADDRFGVCFTGQIGKTYQVEWNSSLAIANGWNALEKKLAEQAPLTWSDPTSGRTNSPRLYRVRLLP